VSASEAETSVSGKTECLLAASEDKKARLLELTPLNVLKVLSQAVGERLLMKWLPVS